MRMSRLLFLGTAMVMMSAALADSSKDSRGHDEDHDQHAQNSAPVVVNGAFLGQIDAMVNFCINANPAAADSYRAFRKGLTGGLTERALDVARDSQDYRQALKTMNSMLDNVPRPQRAQDCVALFAPPH
jgi:hypothetical protein